MQQGFDLAMVPTDNSDVRFPAARRIPRVLLTGFGSFPGVAHNVSGELVIALATEAQNFFSEIDIHTALLPTEWSDGPMHALALQDSVAPDLILHFGVAQGCEGFRIETRAVNACRLIPDAAQLLPASPQLNTAGAPFYSTTIPTDAIIARLSALSLPVSVSDDAGGYLCNAVFYQSLETARATNVSRQIGFIHLPVDLSGPPLTLAQAVTGALEILKVCLADIERAAH